MLLAEINLDKTYLKPWCICRNPRNMSLGRNYIKLHVYYIDAAPTVPSQVKWKYIHIRWDDCLRALNFQFYIQGELWIQFKAKSGLLLLI